MELSPASFNVESDTASPQGSTGITTGLQPSMTLGCGTPGGNIFSDNIGPLHLINIKRVAHQNRPWRDIYLPTMGL